MTQCHKNFTGKHIDTITIGLVTFAEIMLKKLFNNIKNQSKVKKKMTEKNDNTTEEQETLDQTQSAAENTDNQDNAEEMVTDELTELKQQLGETKDKYLRLYAEFDNYKRRSIKERSDNMKRAAQDTMAAILPVLDDFDRAKVNAEKSEETAEVFNQGVGLIVQKLHNILEGKGLEAMETTGEAFDADQHEAVAELPMGDEMKGKIIDTAEKGYTLNGIIIRHAKVVVGK
jgi:molecular chaperone GrpE